MMRHHRPVPPRRVAGSRSTRPRLGREPDAPIGEGEAVDDDAAVVHAALEDPACFGAIFDRHHARIWRYIARMAGRSRADELAGDVFLIAFARRSTYDPMRAPVVAWLYGI